MALEVLEQTTITVDDVDYLVSAMPSTRGLQFMEQYQEEIDSGKDNLAMRKQVICNFVSKDNQMITDKRFDIVFSRKYKHLSKLYTEVVKWNFPDFFEVPGTEE
jgi:hypothetical protein